MLIKREEFHDFKEFSRGYFIEKREGTSAEVLQELKESDGKFYRAIERTVEKQKMKRYIGRLLQSIRREGWLTYENKTWKAIPAEGYCTYCFSPLEEVYLIDIDHHPYCDSDCFDEHEAVGHYDSYADDYLFLFWDVEKLLKRYRHYLQGKVEQNLETHLDLTMILRDMYNVINDDVYATVLFNGGDDGPLAREMYRMMIILKRDVDKLENILIEWKKVLPKTNERFAIEVSEGMMRKRKRPEVLREFIQKHRKYRDKTNKNIWLTTDAMQRMEWYEALTAEVELQDKISWINEVECPQCQKIEESTYSRRTPDGYFYCNECYEELDFEYDFDDDFEEEWLW